MRCCAARPAFVARPQPTTAIGTRLRLAGRARAQSRRASTTVADDEDARPPFPERGVPGRRLRRDRDPAGRVPAWARRRACRRRTRPCCRQCTSPRRRAGATAPGRCRATASRSAPTPPAWTIRAGCTCCPMATSWWRRPTPRPGPTTTRASAAFFMQQAKKRAGAGTPSANRITLLRGLRDDGTAQLKTVFLENLNSPFGMALVGNDFYVANTDAVVRFPYTPGPDADRRRRHQAGRPAGGHAEPPLDQEPDRQPRRQQALRHGRLEQQRRRARHGRRGRPGRDLGDRPRHRQEPHLRFRHPQSERHGLDRRPRRRAGALDRGQRARRDRQRPGARLPHLGARRRLLRLALQLLRPARRRPGAAAEPGAGRQGDRARLRPRPAYRVARPGLVGRRAPAGRPSRAASSSASTARGTAGRTAATR